MLSWVVFRRTPQEWTNIGCYQSVPPRSVTEARMLSETLRLSLGNITREKDYGNKRSRVPMTVPGILLNGNQRLILISVCGPVSERPNSMTDGRAAIRRPAPPLPRSREKGLLWRVRDLIICRPARQAHAPGYRNETGFYRCHVILYDGTCAYKRRDSVEECSARKARPSFERSR